MLRRPWSRFLSGSRPRTRVEQPGRTRRLALALGAVIVVGAVLTFSAGSSAGAQQRGGTLVIAAPWFQPACLSVLPPCSAGWPVLQVLEGAFEVGSDFRYHRNLVSGVDVRKEPFTLTYHIQPKARWSDGTPVTASDFVFTFNAFTDPEVDSWPARPYRAIRRIQAVDAKTLRVSFGSIVADWRELFHVVLPRHALTGEDLTSIWRKSIDNPKTGEPIGNGPFLVERWERGREFSLVRNPRYWGPHTAYLDRVVFRSVRVDSPSMLRSGEVDLFLPESGPDAEWLEARRQGVVKVRLSSGATWEHLAIRIGPGGHPALRSRLVRRALAYGVDREAIVRAIYGLVAPRKGPLDSAVLPSQSRFYQAHWSGYRYRPAEARRLLEQAGCRRGPDLIYVCGGKRLSLRFFTTAGWPLRDVTLGLVQAQLRKVGVEVLTMFAPPGPLFRTVLGSGDFDVLLFAWAPGARLDQSVYVFRCGGSSNFTGYCNRQVSRDLRRSSRVLNPERRAALLNRADARLASDVPVIPLYQASYGVGLRPTVRGVVPADPPDFLTWNSEDWWLVEPR